VRSGFFGASFRASGVNLGTDDDGCTIWRGSLKISKRNADHLPICQLYLARRKKVLNFAEEVRPFSQQYRLILGFAAPRVNWTNVLNQRQRNRLNIGLQ
jgi:hypothetical protein